MSNQNPHYDAVGGEAGIHALVDRFYELMDTLPEAYHIRQMHAADLSLTNEKLFMFLSGWLGGPQLYTEKYGHPRLRMRHAHFPIGARARDEWMLCMDRAMEDVGLEPELRQQLHDAFYKVADFMRNQLDPGEQP